MYRLWRHYRVIYEGSWHGLIDYLKETLPAHHHHYLCKINRDTPEQGYSEDESLRWILTCTEWASLEII